MAWVLLEVVEPVDGGVAEAEVELSGGQVEEDARALGRVPLPGSAESVDDQDALLGVESLQVEGRAEPYGSGSDYQDVSIHGVDRCVMFSDYNISLVELLVQLNRGWSVSDRRPLPLKKDLCKFRPRARIIILASGLVPFYVKCAITTFNIGQSV
jgi:hypothetical protein